MLDLKNGRAVAALAGNRDHYQPVRSILHATANPLDLARAFRETLGLHTLYLADLDAIAGNAPAIGLYENLISSGFHLIVDAGLRNLQSAGWLLDLDPKASTIVAGLETLDGPNALAEILAEIGADRAILSLDLVIGRPRFAMPRAWKSDEPIEIANHAIEQGVRRLLLLDLARVGTGQGLGTCRLFSQIRVDHPEVQISAGGGIAGIADVLELRDSAASAALVASALHDGRISRRELALLVD